MSDTLAHGARRPLGRLLIVDDEPAFGRLVARIATELGFAVKITHGAAAFMMSFPAFDPDLIVMDLVMPEMDGFELIRWIAARPCRARILVATGFKPSYARMVEVLGTSLGLRMIGTLAKPARSADIRAALLRDRTDG